MEEAPKVEKSQIVPEAQLSSASVAEFRKYTFSTGSIRWISWCQIKSNLLPVSFFNFINGKKKILY